MEYKYLHIRRSPDEEILKVLNQNTIGTPGISMLYRHSNVEGKITKIREPHFVNLQKDNTLIGTCCFCSRITSNVKEELRSFYVRYFSFKNAYRKGNGRGRTAPGTSVLRDEVTSLLAGNGLDITSDKRFFHYAYVDPRNVRSSRLCQEFGFEHIRDYATIIFNRLTPGTDARVVQINPAHHASIISLLTDFYKKHTMFSVDNMLDGCEYYTLEAEGKIVAGVQANPEHWSILSLPGITGKVILNTFSHLPVLNKLINKDYHFLTLEAIYYAAGYEHYLEILFESLLANYRLNNAIIVVDKDSRLYRVLRSLNLGYVDKLNKEVNGHVICKFVNFSAAEKNVFKSNPAYISGIDVT